MHRKIVMTCIPYIAKSFPSNDLSRCKSCLLPGPDDLIELASIGYPLLGLSVVESCRRLRQPIRSYLAAVLPGLANRSVKRLDEMPSCRCGHLPIEITQLSA